MKKLLQYLILCIIIAGCLWCFIQMTDIIFRDIENKKLAEQTERTMTIHFKKDGKVSIKTDTGFIINWPYTIQETVIRIGRKDEN